MEIKIFVITTEMEKIRDGYNKLALKLSLNDRKTDLIRLFGGLTEIEELKGYWLNDKGIIETDNVIMWLIYKDNEDYSLIFQLREILAQIKTLTMQKSQAYTVNNDMFLL
jgi:hypothetical protein